MVSNCRRRTHDSAQLIHCTVKSSGGNQCPSVSVSVIMDCMLMLLDVDTISIHPPQQLFACTFIHHSMPAAISPQN